MRERRPGRGRQSGQQGRHGHRLAGGDPDRALDPDRNQDPDREGDGDSDRHGDGFRRAGGTRASPTATGTESSSGSTPIWPWILLGVAVLAALTGWIVHASRRRSATAAGWQSRLIDAYAKGSALHDAMSVAESPGQFAAPDAAGRWTDIQRRADDLTQELYSLREAVPDDGDRARIADTLVSLQAARSAMDAERAPGGPDPRQAEVVRGRLDSFEMSLRALRSGDAEYR